MKKLQCWKYTYINMPPTSTVFIELHSQAFRDVTVFLKNETHMLYQCLSRHRRDNNREIDKETESMNLFSACDPEELDIILVNTRWFMPLSPRTQNSPCWHYSFTSVAAQMEACAHQHKHSTVTHSHSLACKKWYKQSLLIISISRDNKCC